MPEEKKLTSVLKDLGETSSLHGIPKIISSRQVAVKVLWCLLLLGAVSLSTYQIIGLFNEYYAYPVKTSVTLNHANLPFPAITICNSNPIKYSQLTHNAAMNDILINKLSSESGSVDPWSGIGSFYDDAYEAFENASNYDDSYEVYGEEPKVQDGFDSWRERVLTQFRTLPIDVRMTMGHSLDDMLHKLTFQGYQYFMDENTTETFQSPMYGNCFMINIDKKSQSSGPSKGLSFTLVVEKDEYVEHFVSGHGMRLSIHQAGTQSLPDRDSIVLNPGYETNIGLRMVSVSRLGGNYGTCDDSSEGYTVALCSAVCYREHVRDYCDCTPYDSPDDGREEDVICDMDFADIKQCVFDISVGIEDETLTCNCPPRCTADTYSMTLSGRKWPNAKYLQEVLMSKVCKKNITSMNASCEQLKVNKTITSANYDDYASNFLSVNIYFEDLNYEIISEEPMYNTIRFLSDLGGAMGFYMGASLLTYVEILQLLLELCLFCKAKYSTKVDTAERGVSGKRAWSNQ